MNDYRDLFEVQLTQASRRLEARPVSRWAFLRRRMFLVPCAGVILAGSALAATQPWHPTLGNPEAPQEAPTRAADAPPESELAVLGVLRREQTDEDRGRGTEQALGVMSSRGTTGVRVKYVRKVATAADGGSVVLVPSQSWSGGAGTTITDALCLIVVGVTDGYAGKVCFRANDVRTGQAAMSVGSTYYGLMPDGIASVKATIGDRSVTAPVRDNTYVLTTGFSSDDQRPGSDPEHGVASRPDTIEALDALGGVVLRIRP